MTIDVQTFVSDILGALRGALSEGWSKISAFAEKQAKMLAQQGALIAQSRLAGTLAEDDDLFDFFVQQLKDLTTNFARSVATMTLLTIEQAWNALVGVVWGTVNKALSAGRLAGLPLPTLTLGAG